MDLPSELHGLAFPAGCKPPKSSERRKKWMGLKKNVKKIFGNCVKKLATAREYQPLLGLDQPILSRERPIVAENWHYFKSLKPPSIHFCRSSNGAHSRGACSLITTQSGCRLFIFTLQRKDREWQLKRPSARSQRPLFPLAMFQRPREETQKRRSAILHGDEQR